MSSGTDTWRYPHHFWLQHSSPELHQYKSWQSPAFLLSTDLSGLKLDTYWYSLIIAYRICTTGFLTTDNIQFITITQWTPPACFIEYLFSHLWHKRLYVPSKYRVSQKIYLLGIEQLVAWQKILGILYYHVQIQFISSEKLFQQAAQFLQGTLG